MNGDVPYRPQRAADEVALQRLRRWLDAELLGGGGFVMAGFVLPVTLLTVAATLAALAFTPVLVHTLWTLERKGWLLAYGLLAGLPTLVGFVSGDWLLRFVGTSFGLVAFYALCAFLRAAVHEWHEEAQWRKAFMDGMAASEA